jgi:hypothetical protein
MDSNTDLDSAAADVKAYLATYVPTTLNASQWATVAETVRDLVARSEPRNGDDAKKVAGSLTEFLAWTDFHLGLLDVTVAVTDDNIERWFHALAGGKSNGSRSNQRGRVRRILRVLSGQPARTKRTPRGPGPAPYSADVLEAGIGLTQAGIERTLLASALVTATPFVELKRSLGDDLTRLRCNGLLAHLPLPDSATYAVLLRGGAAH